MKTSLYIIALFLIILSDAALFTSCKNKPFAPTVSVCSGEAGVMCNVAGKAGEPGGGGNGGSALNSTLYWPADVMVDNAGGVMIIDFNNHCIRKVGADGIISVFEGSGFLGDSASGHASHVNMNHPSSMTQDANGDYWIASWHNWKIKKVDRTTMFVTSPVGTTQGFLGDGGPANAAKMDLPSSVVFDSTGNMYISDQGNQRIRKVDISTMIITTIAGDGTQSFANGTGTAAKFNFPKGTDAGPAGRICISSDKLFIYIADTQNNRIRKLNVATGEVTTIAGTGTAGFSGDGGDAINAELNYPTDVAISSSGVLFVADSKNHTIRKIDTNGIISTCAGVPGVAGYSDDRTRAVNAKLNTPRGVFITNDNILYIADTYNNQIKKVVDP